MNNCNNSDKIISYIENELKGSEKDKFEAELRSNQGLNAEYNEMLSLIKSLNNLPSVKSSSNFLVSLNRKIDKYEESKNKVFSFSKLYNVNNYMPKFALGALSIMFLFTLTYFVNNFDFNGSYLMLSKSSNSSDILNNEVVDSDSLIINDNIVVGD